MNNIDTSKSIQIEKDIINNSIAMTEAWEEYEATYQNWTRAILIKGLSYNIRSAHIDEIFSNFGNIYSIDLGYKKGHSTGKALVHFDSHGSALNAIANMDHGNIDGLEISVELANPRKTIDEY